eukprot:TRINITY_DN1828_c0_g2_i1.p1 TRINITY_DN1828_c0_g2~~TRINITY_DN1828_c0_g2_i1.p1  ORF type:complete len:541 (-),score=78.31 TRINITY_DN1828_c0_g2_i1:157-1779(-)
MALFMSTPSCLASGVFFLVCLLVVRSASGTPAFRADLITDLPGAPNAAFKMYSGYITVDEDHGKALFYWFVESVLSSDTKPLTLWLNGGPGCSSVGVGALEELGPFFTNKNANGLIPNYYAWNRESNMLFVESPIGTGFSYSNTSSDYKMGDKETAKDARIFLLKWLEKFPHYQGRDFFIAGESYGGHYVPYLAKELWDNMETNVPYIPFKGFAVGNPWTDPAVDYGAEVDFWYTRALISTEVYTNLTQKCGVVDYWRDVPGSDCLDYLTKAYAEMGDINIFHVYVDVCTPSTQVAQNKAMLNMKFKNIQKAVMGRLASQRTEGQQLPALRGRKMASTPLANAATPAVTVGTTKYPWEYDPCAHFEAEIYLNRKDVQKALHANTTGLTYPWMECSEVLQFYEADSLASVVPIYRELLKTPLRMTVFSGDVDSAIPTMGTRKWILELEQGGHLNKTKSWDAWYLDQQVGGYTEQYNNGLFNFVTVRNAGHMVPFMQPARAFEVFKAFLHDQDMPRKEAMVTSHVDREAMFEGAPDGNVASF